MTPKTLQRIVELKAQYPQAINLLDLKPDLDRSPVSEEADAIDTEINRYLDRVWQKVNVRSHLVAVLKYYLHHLQPASAEVKTINFETLLDLYLGSNPPVKPTREQFRDLLLESSIALSDYLECQASGQVDFFRAIEEWLSAEY
jgi:hypothetical protein